MQRSNRWAFGIPFCLLSAILWVGVTGTFLRDNSTLPALILAIPTMGMLICMNVSFKWSELETKYYDIFSSMPPHKKGQYWQAIERVSEVLRTIQDPKQLSEAKTIAEIFGTLPLRT